MPALKHPDVRRVFSPEFKWQIVRESKERTLSVSELARKYDVNTNQVFRWMREAEAGQALWVRQAVFLHFRDMNINFSNIIRNFYFYRTLNAQNFEALKL